MEQRIIGNRIFYIDNENKLLFTKGELKIARARYQKELAKKLARQ